MSFWIESVIECSVILLVALALVALLRQQSAALRHWVLSVALACAAFAPAAGAIVPNWEVSWVTQLERQAVATLSTAPLDLGTADASVSRAAGASDSAAPSSMPSLIGILFSVWMSGVFVAVAILVAALGRLAYLTARSRPIAEGVWRDRAVAIAGPAGVARRVQLLATTHSSLLVAWGALRPRIVVPAAALEWPRDRVDVVLAHELAHIRRNDWLVQIFAEIMKCVFWFNPVVWMACSRLRRESEQACDDAVLAGGIGGPGYAEHLVSIARELKQRREWMPAVAMARPSSLERRVRTMLDERINRRPLSRSVALAACLAVTAVAIPLAGSAAQTFATVTGTVSDSTNGVIPGATLVLTNVQTEAKYEVRSNAAGRYEFVGLVPGDYLFEARLPGFASLKGRLTLSGQTVQQDIKLQIGSLQETITVQSTRSATSAPTPALAAPIARPGSRPCEPARAADGTVRVGGNIRPPMKLRDVRPVYPVSMSSQGVTGTVQLEAQIGTDGLVNDVRVVSAPHAELGTAAADAVRNWMFTETMLNCVPVPVQMRVTVNFTLQQ